MNKKKIKAFVIPLYLVIMALIVNSCCKTKREYYSSIDGKGKNLKYIYQLNALSGKKCGYFVWLTEKGDTIESAEFKNDKLNGVAKYFHDNGKIQLQVECYNDMMHGITREYYQNGQLRCELLYNFDSLWEIKVVFDSSGNVLNSGQLEKGNGMVKIYYPSGKVEYEGEFINGFRSGYWKFYTESGCVFDSINYQNGYREGSKTRELMY